MIICRMDEMIFHSSGIHSLKERFDDLADGHDFDDG
jgi:hypothetical protein